MPLLPSHRDAGIAPPIAPPFYHVRVRVLLSLHLHGMGVGVEGGADRNAVAGLALRFNRGMRFFLSYIATRRCQDIVSICGFARNGVACVLLMMI